jgi:hypothetical protein
MGFTDACTFIKQKMDFGTELIAIYDASTGSVGTELEGDFVAQHYLDVVKTHLARQIGEHNRAVFKLHTECSVGQWLDNDSGYFWLFLVVQGCWVLPVASRKTVLQSPTILADRSLSVNPSPVEGESRTPKTAIQAP